MKGAEILMELRVADVGGPVHFIDFGGSGPPMVLVHGLGGSSLNWLAVGPALARRARVVALDLPGFGRTPPAGRSTRVAAQGELLGRFIEAALGGPATVVGNSMGGLIAMIQAVAGPELVTRLVLAAPAQPFGARIDPQVFAAFALYALPGIGPWYVRRRSAQLGPGGLVREMLRMCCVDPSRVPAAVREAHVALAAERADGMPWVTTAFLDAARSTVAAINRRRAFRAIVERITAPVLLIQGARDRLVRVSASGALARLRPDWTFEVLDDVGHLAQMEDPERFVDVVNRWLDRLGAAPGSGEPA